MTYRSLLVQLGPDARAATRTQAAIELARRLQAHLVGLAPTGRMEVPAVVDPVGAVGDLVAGGVGVAVDGDDFDAQPLQGDDHFLAEFAGAEQHDAQGARG